MLDFWLKRSFAKPRLYPSPPCNHRARLFLIHRSIRKKSSNGFEIFCLLTFTRLRQARSKPSLKGRPRGYAPVGSTMLRNRSSVSSLTRFRTYKRFFGSGRSPGSRSVLHPVQVMSSNTSFCFCLWQFPFYLDTARLKTMRLGTCLRLAFALPGRKASPACSCYSLTAVVAGALTPHSVILRNGQSRTKEVNSSIKTRILRND